MMDYKRYRCDLQVRFADTDALGHINNAVYHSYIELCRTQWLAEVLHCGLFTSSERFPIILARTEMDYLKQGHLQDRLHVEAFISHIGEKSFHQRYEIKTPQHTVAVAKAVLVWFDFHANQSVAIPEDKKALMRYYMPVD
ncbi:acyl-CoA thioesterase [Oligoflexus tunisiensis]|uniref:acyl-CoA thioesterase n=1 Tax=Oligoflexus tunisiensis TaxID=708132 RepID=UPI000B151C39|nr:acyl-CoA thioesterase [Oligoflexus tunisiensis]